MPALTYSYATWIANYPEFAGCSDAQGQAWFNRAGIYFQNEVCNPAYCAGAAIFEQLYYLVVSHIAWLSAPRDSLGNPSSSGAMAPAVVGRISSASEGSVSVSAEWTGGGSPSEAFWIQTPYGAQWWTATAQYRLMRYSPRPTIVADGVYPYVGAYGRRRW